MSARGGGDGVPLPRWIGVGRHSVAAAGWRAARWDGESRFAATDLGRGPRRARYGPAVHLEPSWSRFDGSCASYAGGRSRSRRPGCFDDGCIARRRSAWRCSPSASRRRATRWSVHRSRASKSDASRPPVGAGARWSPGLLRRWLGPYSTESARSPARCGLRRPASRWCSRHTVGASRSGWAVSSTARSSLVGEGHRERFGRPRIAHPRAALPGNHGWSEAAACRA